MASNKESEDISQFMSTGGENADVDMNTVSEGESWADSLDVPFPDV